MTVPSPAADAAEDFLVATGLAVHFPLGHGLGRRSGVLRAVDGVDLSIRKGETLGLVGESGCGKSTLGRALLQLEKPTSGSVRFDGVELMSLPPNQMRKMRRRLQIIFQDPYASLDPRMTVENIIGEPLRIHRLARGRERRKRVRELLQLVGLSGRSLDQYPHEFSGGQRQRIGIARALAVSPDLVVADEPISALDVSIQAQVVNLLEELQEALDLTYLFIAHDLAIVRHISTRVAVMYLGKIVELADRKELYERPLHPYTQALLAAVPIPDPAVEQDRPRTILKGDLPNAIQPPSGCRFHTRCPLREKLGNPEVCSTMEPSLAPHRPG